MDRAFPGRSPRPLRLVLAGVGVAIGWMLLSFVLGLSSSSALADESQDSGGLLGAVGAVAEGGAETVGAVAEPVTDTAATVVEGGTDTVEKVAAPVADAATTVVDGGTDTVEEVAAPVTGTAVPVVDDATDAVGEVTKPATAPVSEIVGAGASVVDDASGALTGTVGTVAEDVTKTAGDLAAAAPLQPVVRPVAEVAASAVDAVGELTASVGEQRPVSHVVEVVTDVVEQTPVVGKVAEAAGIPDAVEQIGGSIDDGVESVGETVGDSGHILAPAGPVPAAPAVRPPAAGEGPGSPAATPPSHAIDTSLVNVVAAGTSEADAAVTASFAASGVLQLAHRLSDGTRPSAAGGSTSASPVVGDGATASPDLTAKRGGLFDSPGGVLPGDATAAGSGGASLGTWGLIAFGPLFAYRAWMRRAGPEDDRLPGAPIFETDASPD
ncbi:hypothetical protein FBY40_0568 [Microbacterium sp. SLBN-154]|uniref:hypothetical protein n=1 Tax=Microbacterium sp. SLBN-154 TaxID=2768458 RepID=UPI001175B788|nr:hypothetical protein [Microbacterium sp. SLBN-154]TQK18082.1 hypothetical protein FBY40_0568 [Microbacterium sp. SLBN-154]